MRNLTIIQHTYKVCRADTELFEGVPLNKIIYTLWYCLYHLKVDMVKTDIYFKSTVHQDFRVSRCIKNNEELILVSKETSKNYLVYPLIDIPVLKNQVWGRQSPCSDC